MRRRSHNVSTLNVHLVFVTRYRAKTLTAERFEDLALKLIQIAARVDATIIEFNGEEDHVHILVDYPPKTSVSTMVRLFKGITAHDLKILWSHGYYAGSVGTNVEDVKRYIQEQTAPK